jgi:hypothetical protein
MKREKGRGQEGKKERKKERMEAHIQTSMCWPCEGMRST